LLLLTFAIGFVAGLRSLTAPAAVSWAACLGALNLEGTALHWMGSTAAVAIFSLLAIAELIADKLPRTPNRTRAGPLIGRILLGGLAAAALTTAAGQSPWLGALLGGIGAVAGTFAGYEIRRRLVTRLRMRDLPVALAEDLVAIGLALVIVDSH
jgi:uncharacterized membrane protein